MVATARFNICIYGENKGARITSNLSGDLRELFKTAQMNKNLRCEQPPRQSSLHSVSDISVMVFIFLQLIKNRGGI